MTSHLLLDRISTAAMCAPDCIAVIHRQASLTYRQLWGRASELAFRLAPLVPDERVAIGGRRDICFAVAALGTMLAGGCYLPLDPDMPSARLRSLARRAGARRVAAMESDLGAFAGIDANPVAVDLLTGTISDDLCARAARSEGSLAYALPTSGSTGEPKLVAIEQSSVAALLDGFNQIAPANARVVTVAVCPFSFDVSVFEIFAALAAGGTVVLADQEDARNPDALAALIARHHVTTCYLPPFLLHDFIAALERGGRNSTLERVLVGVEPIAEGLLQRLLDVCPGLVIVNGYGPTEATICSTFFRFTNARHPARRTPIGRAVEGWIVDLVDQDLEPVAQGEVGEIIIAGAGLARGYLGEDSTHRDTAFIARPGKTLLSEGVANRWYRTGDFARRDEHGDIVFVGRRDDQIKIRGFRIELGEIEVALKSHPSVRSALVLAPQGPFGRRLLAFAETTLDPDTVRAHLAETLPAYMQPARVETMTAFPLTEHGKADRAAMLALVRRRPYSVPLRVPATPLEKAFARIWADLLQLDEVGIDDDFFELGGDSRLALSVARLMADAAGMPDHASSFLQYATVAEAARAAATAESSVDLPSADAHATECAATVGQQGLWAWQNMRSDDTAYVQPIAFIFGGVNKTVVRAMLDRIMRRHDAFSTVVTLAGTELVLRAGEIAAVIDDNDPLREASLSADLAIRFAMDSGSVLDLGRSPVRVRVMTTDDNGIVVLFSMHHVVVDGFSVRVIAEDFARELEGREIASPIPGISAFAAYQRVRAGLPATARDKAYWIEMLSPLPAAVSFGVRRPQNENAPRVGATLEQPLSGLAAAALLRLARRLLATPFEVALTLAGLTVHTTTGQDDFVLSTPASLRPLDGTFDGTVGYLVNLLPIRMRIDRTQNFSALLAAHAARLREGRAHVTYPFETLLRDLSTTETVQAARFTRFVVAEEVDAGLPMRVGGIDIDLLNVPRTLPMYELTLFVVVRGANVTLRWEYDASLFDRTSIERLGAFFGSLLVGIAHSPNRPLHDIPLADKAERDALFDAAMLGMTSAMPSSSLVEQVERRVNYAPDAVALKGDDVCLTYGELWRASDRLARHLARAGVTSEAPVLLLACRHPAFVVAILAILRAGGCYVPLDDRVPAGRVAAVAEQSKARAMLVTPGIDSARVSDIATELNTSVIVLEMDGWDRETATAEQTALPDRTPESPAYIMFTSGSTGTPKGVVVPDRGVIRLAVYPNYASFGESDTFVLMSNLAFDAATLEIWGALLNGGRLVIPADSTAKDPVKLLTCIAANGVTAGFFNVTLFRWLVETDPAALSGMHTILVGGENVPYDLFVKAARTLHYGKLVNGYGPTENTTFSCCYRLSGSPRRGDPIPIGFPLAYSAAMIFDEGQRPVPPGAVGEIVVAGAGLALGYVGNEEETAKKFIEVDGRGVWYRTGDRGQQLPDGAIVCLGRMDDQIKIRGFRIEVGEIETTLRHQPGVRDAVVLAPEAEGGPRLEAYVEGEADRDDLNFVLKRLLPDYMVPARIFILDRLPTNRNGKVDRSALLAMGRMCSDQPTRGTRADSTDRAPARMGRKSLGILTALFREALKLDIIDPNERFFNLGVNSLLLVILATRIGKTFDRKVDAVTLLDHPTLSMLSEWLDAAIEEMDGDKTAPCRASRVDGHDRRVAIVGMAGRFPGAGDIPTFWARALAGQVDIVRVRSKRQGEIPFRGVLADADRFDSGYFGVTEREACMMDPQQRVLIEVAQQAFDDAAIDVSRELGPISVYAACGPVDQGPLSESLSERYEQQLARTPEFAATRVSYRLDLRGESVTVQTGCSSSLVAVHLACQSLIEGRSTLALAAAASFPAVQDKGYGYEDGMITSPTGSCRPFDISADGTVPGGGAAAVVLAKLSDARRLGLPIHAVIRSTAVNNDGSSKVGFMAPSPSGQAQAIVAAHTLAGVSSSDIAYVETHGTGTQLGDAIEIEALSRVFGAGRAIPCALGSTKANSGHMDRASGIAGLIRATLAVREGMIPPMAAFTKANSALGLEQKGFRVLRQAEPWPLEIPRVAAVSSFGVGGTNAHAIIEALGPSVTTTVQAERTFYLLPVSARSQVVLASQVDALVSALESSDIPLSSVSATLIAGRRQLSSRVAVVARNKVEAITALRSCALTSSAAAHRKVVWVFPGQGDDGVEAFRSHYESDPVYKGAFDACAERFRLATGFDVRDDLFSETGQAHILEDMARLQPVMFSLEWAHVEFWRERGFVPDAVFGHSLGEVTAATVAGVFSLDDAIRLVTARSRLMQGTAPGAMLSVAMSERDVEPYLLPGVTIAARNGRQLLALSGSRDDIATVANRLEAAGIAPRRLAVPRAAHHEIMREAAVELNKVATTLELHPPRLPIISNITGTWGNANMAEPGYWGRHITTSVEFAESLDLLARDMPDSVLFVPGPGESLARMIAFEIGEAVADVVTMPGGAEKGARRAVLETTGRLWSLGVPLALERTLGTTFGVVGGGAIMPPRVSLPGTVFDHGRSWPMGAARQDVGGATAVPSSVARLPDPGAWLWTEEWQKLEMSAVPSADVRWAFLSQPPAGYEMLREMASADEATDLVWVLPNFDPTGFIEAGRRLVETARRNVRVWLCPVGTDASDVLFAADAAALAFVRSAPLEKPGAKWHLVRGLSPHNAACARLLVKLLRTNTVAAEVMELRDGAIFAQTFRHAWPGWRARAMRDGGVYVITGGTGRVARSLVQAIGREVRATIVLLGRRAAAEICNDLAVIRAAADNLSVDLRYYSVDVTDTVELRRLFDELRAGFGRIDGVIHAAGATDTRFFPLLGEGNPDQIMEIAKAKQRGCHALAAALTDSDADFVILCSSLSTVLGGVGFAAYIAANAFLDDFAARKVASGDMRWISVAWDAWTGNTLVDDSASREDPLNPARFALSDADGIALFRRILAIDGSLVLVSTGDIESRRQSISRLEWDDASTAASHEASPIMGSDLAHADLSAIVRDVLRNVMGSEPTDPERDLRYEGLESLTILQILTRLRKRLSITISLAEAMRALTVNGLIGLVTRAQVSSAQPKTFEIVRVPFAQTYPVSSVQRRWLLLMPKRYGDLDVVIEAKGACELTDLAGAVRTVILAHSGLRTRFPRQGESWVQLIEPGASVDEVDLLARTSDEQVAYLRELTERKSAEWFDVENKVPFDVTVVRLAPDRHALVLHAHHVLFDGSSSSLFFRDVVRAMLGEAIVPQFQYVDYAVAQYTYANSFDIVPTRNYWLAHFKGAPPPTRVPSDFGDTGDTEDRGAFVRFRIAADVMNNIRVLARERHATPFIFMFAAFGLLLYEKTGQRDLVVGTTAAGRPGIAAEDIIGVFVNPLPLRVRFNPEGTLDTYLDQVRSILFNFHEYQNYPMEDLTLHVPPFLDSGLNDTFNAYILYQNYWRPDDERMTFRRLDVGARVHHKLMREYEFVLEDDGQAVAGEFWYRPSRYRKDTAEEAAARFVYLVEALAGKCQLFPISQLNNYADAEPPKTAATD